MYKRCLHLCCFLVITCAMQAMGSLSAKDKVFPSFFVLTSDTVKQAPSFSDEEFYRLSTQVIFKVNSTQISPDDDFFKLYKNEILPAVNEQHLQLRKIYIRGAASPEGPYYNNRRLSRARSQVLLDALMNDLAYQYKEAEVDVNMVTEDYGYLCVLMKEANDKEFSIVKGIYEECQGNELACKKKLIAYNKGILWRRLYREYFPQLRAARFFLWFSEPDEEHAPEPKFEPLQPIINLPQVTAWCHDALRIPTMQQPEPEYKRRHLIAVRTNLVHDFFYMPKFGMAYSPNIQLEYYPLRGHYTYNLGFTWGTNRRWEQQQFWQVRDLNFEVRRYFKGKGQFIGTYLGAFVHGDVYGIGTGPDEGWQGEGGGGGISIGHTLPLNRKKTLRLEFMAAAGFFMTIFDPYVYGNPVTNESDGYYYYDYLGNASSFKKRNHRFTWFGPTNVGVQITYDVIYRKKQRVR